LGLDILEPYPWMDENREVINNDNDKHPYTDDEVGKKIIYYFTRYCDRVHIEFYCVDL